VSTLLDDIINLAETSSQPLADILRKCLRLGHELKNDRLKTWANQELNGYRDGAEVPPYRIVHAPAYGNFVGPFHAQYRHHIIIPATMDEEHQHWTQTLNLHQSVSALDSLAKEAGPEGTLMVEWPANMVAYYQTRLIQRFVCHNAWQEMPKSVMVELLDTVRNKTFRMALEIKDELGTSYADLNKLKTKEAEIQNIVIHNVGNVAFGNASVDASGQTTIVGDRKSLDAVLVKAGLDDSDLAELSQATQVDGGVKPGKPGTRLDSWIQSKAGKVVVGGVKVGLSIGQQLLTDWLLIHAGLKKP
jgi:hypothetical protein